MASFCQKALFTLNPGHDTLSISFSVNLSLSLSLSHYLLPLLLIWLGIRFLIAFQFHFNSFSFLDLRQTDLDSSPQHIFDKIKLRLSLSDGQW
jgi:hypothetical protein